MTGNAPASRGKRALFSRSVRRAVRAPDLERYLGRRSVDLLVTDQIESLQVRVRKGLEVFERKIAAGLAAARSRIALLAGWTLLCAAAAFWIPDDPWLRIVLYAAGAGAALGLLGACIDRARLKAAANRPAGMIETAKTAEELLEFAGKTLDAARRLGMVEDAS